MNSTITLTTDVPVTVKNLTDSSYKTRLGLVCDDYYCPILDIDFQKGTFACETEHNSTNTTTRYKANGFGTTYYLARDVDGAGFAAWAAEALAPLIARVQAGMTSDWDGNNTVAVFDEDAAEAREEIRELLQGGGCGDAYAYPVIPEGAGYYDAASYLQDSSPAEFGIDGNSTDAEIDAAAAKIVSDAEDHDLILSQSEVIGWFSDNVESADSE